MNRFHTLAAALSLCAVIPLGACGKSSGETAKTDGKSASNATLASAIADVPHLSTVSSALSDAGLASVFDGPGSYTLLAPEDAAFDKLGDGKKELTAPESRAVLVAILRDHILPGAVTPDAIRQAIKAKGGPVTMRTLGDGTVKFSSKGNDIMIAGDGGTSATLDGQAVTASNGVVMPIDGLLKVPQPKAAATT
jgi:uncharacterized surface protein with fasciclin (FAS1) repeats